MCICRLNPYAEHMYDGIDLSPFEIMFIKLKEYLLEANWTTATQGKKYSDWNTHPVGRKGKGEKGCETEGVGGRTSAKASWVLGFLVCGWGLVCVYLRRRRVAGKCLW